MNVLRVWALLSIALSPFSFSTSTEAIGGLPVVAPETVGLSGERLERIGVLMRKHVEGNRIPGATALVARHGGVAYAQTFGMQDVEAGRAMKMDTIHRIYSMSKPITSVAVMMLYEEGRFLLNDPVSRYLPELGKLSVGVEEKDPETGKPALRSEPARREMTIRDLLRHTSGLTYGVFGNTLVDQAYRKEGILGDVTLAEMVARLAKLPLLYQPGTTWHYSVSTDVLGRLVEVVTGTPFDRFLEERIFSPLRMQDTAFFVPSNKSSRLAKLYSPVDGGGYKVAASGAARDYLAPPTLFSGGGGLVSTAADYLRFCRMLMNGGQLDGVRLLSRKSVELMTMDHLGGITMGLGLRGYGFGLGFAVNKNPGETGSLGTAGEYNWGGAAGTRFWIDPKEDMIGIFLIQILPHTGLEYGTQFRALAYQSIVD